MIGATIQIEGNPGLKRLRKRVADTKGLLQVAGRAGRNTLVRHLRAKNRSNPNKLGGPRTNFYAKAADAVSFAFVGDSAVEVSSSAIGLALRFHGTAGLPGGVLRPVNGGVYLTQAAAPEAHGKRAREFSDLKFGFAFDPALGRMRPALVRPSDSLLTLHRRAKKGAGRPVVLPSGPGTAESDGEPIFWLNRKARMKGDDTVLPPEGMIADEAEAAVEEYAGLLDERRPA